MYILVLLFKEIIYICMIYLFIVLFVFIDQNSFVASVLGLTQWTQFHLIGKYFKIKKRKSYNFISR